MTVENHTHDTVCWHCGESGHTSVNCLIKKRGEEARLRAPKRYRASGEGGSYSANVVERDAGSGC